MKKLLLFILLMNVLELYSQNAGKTYIIDDKPKLLENSQKQASSIQDLYFINGELLNPMKLNVLNLKLSEYSYYYVALYNKSTMSYQYYPTNFKINFNLNSPLFAGQNINPKDSFNPYGGHKPQVSLAFGVLSLFLKKIQE